MRYQGQPALTRPSSERLFDVTDTFRYYRRMRRQGEMGKAEQARKQLWAHGFLIFKVPDHGSLLDAGPDAEASARSPSGAA